MANEADFGATRYDKVDQSQPLEEKETASPSATASTICDSKVSLSETVA